jgi:nucleoside-diphosphate-sugar epimerase
MSANVQGHGARYSSARAGAVEKLVYARPPSCYGLAAVPTREDHPIQPQYPYALSKYQGEQAAFHWHRVYQLPVNSIRIFNAYGTRSRTSGAYGAVFGVFLRQKLAGKPYTVVGDGTQSRDFLYVTDVATAFLAAAETAAVGPDLESGRGQSAAGQPPGRAARRRQVHIPKAAGRARVHARRHRQDHRRAGLEAAGELRGRGGEDRRRYRLLEERPALGSGLDRQGHPDLVPAPRAGVASCCHRSPRSTSTRSRPRRS